MAHDPERWRPLFPILGKTVYLISNSLGAMPAAARDRLHEYADLWSTRGVRAWHEGWLELPVEVGNMVAPIIGAPLNSITMQHNVTSAQAIVLSCFEPTATRNRIVCEDGNFPSVLYYYAEQLGLKLVTAPVEKLVDAIDERTLLVPTSHVLYKSSYLQDARAVIEKAHRVGAHVVLDVFQSAGVVPISVQELEVDFAVGGCLKWLCGGPGNAYLYVRPDLRDKLRPRFTGWMAHADPFNFEPPPIRRANGPMRWLNGTPSIPSLYAAMEGLKIIAQVGVKNIRRHSLALTTRLLEKIREIGWPTITPLDPERRGGTVAVNPPNAKAVSDVLLERDFIIDYRPEAGIRIAPHFYTTADECDMIVEEMAAILANRPSLRVTREK